MEAPIGGEVESAGGFVEAMMEAPIGALEVPIGGEMAAATFPFAGASVTGAVALIWTGAGEADFDEMGETEPGAIEDGDEVGS